MKYKPSADFLSISKLVTQNLIPLRRSRKSVEIIPQQEEPTLSFSDNAEMMRFNAENKVKSEVKNIEDVILNETGSVTWFNLYGVNYPKQVDRIIKQNRLDSFLSNLIGDPNHRTKVVPLENCFFFTAKSIHSSDEHAVVLEQIMFIVSGGFVWSIQEKVGDHFDHIRERIDRKIGNVRSQGTDYLLFLLLESIVDNYYLTYEDIMENTKDILESNLREAEPNQLEQIEVRKTQLFRIRRSLANLREALNQIAVIDPTIIKPSSQKYFSELKEQTAYLGDLIDHDLTRLEAATNLFFSLQSHKLNEVMKTLTILSVIFIPLTFIAGIYGMNFDNMPELRFEYGYFVAIGVMAAVAIGSIIYFKRKKWF